MPISTGEFLSGNCALLLVAASLLVRSVSSQCLSMADSAACPGLRIFIPPLVLDPATSNKPVSFPDVDTFSEWATERALLMTKSILGRFFDEEKCAEGSSLDLSLEDSFLGMRYRHTLNCLDIGNRFGFTECPDDLEEPVGNQAETRGFVLVPVCASLCKAHWESMRQAMANSACEARNGFNEFNDFISEQLAGCATKPDEQGECLMEEMGNPEGQFCGFATVKDVCESGETCNAAESACAEYENLQAKAEGREGESDDGETGTVLMFVGIAAACLGIIGLLSTILITRARRKPHATFPDKGSSDEKRLSPPPRTLPDAGQGNFVEASERFVSSKDEVSPLARMNSSRFGASPANRQLEPGPGVLPPYYRDDGASETPPESAVGNFADGRKGIEKWPSTDLISSASSTSIPQTRSTDGGDIGDRSDQQQPQKQQECYQQASEATAGVPSGGDQPPVQGGDTAVLRWAADVAPPAVSPVYDDPPGMAEANGTRSVSPRNLGAPEVSAMKKPVKPLPVQLPKESTLNVVADDSLAGKKVQFEGGHTTIGRSQGDGGELVDDDLPETRRRTASFLNEFGDIMYASAVQQSTSHEQEPQYRQQQPSPCPLRVEVDNSCDRLDSVATSTEVAGPPASIGLPDTELLQTQLLSVESELPGCKAETGHIPNTKSQVSVAPTIPSMQFLNADHSISMNHDFYGVVGKEGSQGGVSGVPSDTAGIDTLERELERERQTMSIQSNQQDLQAQLDQLLTQGPYGQHGYDSIAPVKAATRADTSNSGERRLPPSTTGERRVPHL